MPVLLSEELKAKCRHHLGYPEVTSVATFFLGVPAAVQPQFMLEGAYALILESALKRIEQCVRILDHIEELNVEGIEDLEVQEIEGIVIDAKFMEKRWKQYMIWRAALGNVFGVMPNPYDMRLPMMGGGINVPVRH